MKQGRARTKIILTAAGIILAIGAGLLTYNAVLSDRWTGNPEPPGRQIEIDGYSLYVTDTGAGSSTIVILHDILSFSPEWWGIQKELSGTARVISYDRPGYGWSQRRSGPRDSAHAVKELEEVLAHLNVRGACVLIGQVVRPTIDAAAAMASAGMSARVSPVPAEPEPAAELTGRVPEVAAAAGRTPRGAP